MVGVRGFEPPTFASRTQRSNQAEPHPDLGYRFSCFFYFRTCGMSFNIASLLFFANTISSFFLIFIDFVLYADCKSKRSP